IKLEKRQREEFLPLIRPTLEEPNAIVKQADGALIFVKDFGTTKFFASVARNDSKEWVVTSNAPKTLNNLLNKVKEGGEVLISDLPGLPIIARPHDIAALRNGANQADSTTHPLKIEPNPEFGENFAEYAGKGAEAVKKLLEEKRGQVSGAFYRPDLGESGGYIDLVWGNYELKAAPGAKKPKSYGLSKILEKHAKDFESFKGADVREKVVNGITEIIERGELKEKDGVKTLYLYNEFGEFKVGLSKGWNKKGDNTWVITAYKVRTPPAQLSDQAQLNKDMGYSSPKGEIDSTTTPLKKQTTAQGKNYLKSLSPEELKKAEDETYQELSLLATKPLSTTPLTKEQLFKELKGYKHFGHDFTEFRDKGLEALELIAKKKHGQVSGAYYRADLGAIDIGYQLPLSNNTQRGLVDLLAGRGASDTQTNIYYWGKPALAPFAGNTDKEKILRAVDKIIKEGTYSLEEGHHMLNLELDNGIYQLELFPLSLKQPSHFYPMSIQYHHKPKNPNSPMERE
ncbi:PBECR2 nuclease fold domain-containing protein, partial [Helicobacter ailurogastricus]